LPIRAEFEINIAGGNPVMVNVITLRVLMLMSHENTFAERDLTERERLTAHWLLENGNADAAQYAEQLSDATVVGVCGCGCASIDFAVDGETPVSSGMHLLSDYYWVDDDDHTGGIFVFAKSGQLAGLEVYSMDGECNVSQLPDVDRLLPMPDAENA